MKSQAMKSFIKQEFDKTDSAKLTGYEIARVTAVNKDSF